jgi:biotin carboxyl carrier protein
MAFIINDPVIAAIKTPGAEFSISDLQPCQVTLIDSSKLQVILNHKVYIVHVDQISPDLRKYSLRSGHFQVEVELIRHIDRLVKLMGLSQSLQSRVEDLKAPMPGLVKKILVAERDTVAAGQNLLLLEAMKMENIIKSPQAGVIKQIAIAEHQTVDKGQLLIKFEG